jgi:ABC-type enterochelin transport system substrate-binding protein
MQGRFSEELAKTQINPRHADQHSESLTDIFERSETAFNKVSDVREKIRSNKSSEASQAKNAEAINGTVNKVANMAFISDPILPSSIHRR